MVLVGEPYPEKEGVGIPEPLTWCPYPGCVVFQNAKALKAKKEDGNKAFKEGNYKLAYELYTEALGIDPNNIKTNAKLYCNRGTVNSKVRSGHHAGGLFISGLIPQQWLLISRSLILESRHFSWGSWSHPVLFCACTIVGSVPSCQRN